MALELLAQKPLFGPFVLDDTPSSGLDVESKIFGSFHIGPYEVWITQTVVTTWVIMAALILLALIFRLKLKNYKEKPSGSQNVIELIVEFMDNFARSTMTDEYAYFGNWFFGVFCFVLVSNLSGLLGFRPPTADLCTTLGVTLTTFFLIHFMGIKKGKGGYFKGYLEPLPLLLPINIISELATPISLSFRLFGNILGGMIIMAMVYQLPRFLNFGIPAVLHIYFDVFAGCIQTVIFVMLSMTFIKDKIPD
ncbi:MAG: F0F1 ATP synthase subunit A [Firmicutes bacterium]|nr:F0F1 ATP synthase subunit A [Bacillota bacterium]